MKIASARRIANIAINDAMILALDTTPGPMRFSEKTRPDGIFGKDSYYLYGAELGQVSGPAATICEALNWDPQFDGSDRVKIETNVRLEELFEILNSYAFETLMHNTSSFKINEVEIDQESLQRVLIWYKGMRETEKKYFVQKVIR